MTKYYVKEVVPVWGTRLEKPQYECWPPTIRGRWDSIEEATKAIRKQVAANKAKRKEQQNG